MATLEKIRSKSVLLIVIIGIALIAFIIGDFLNSGRSVFGTGTTVAKVDGKKLDVMEFQRRLQEQSALYQNQNRKIDAALLEQQVIDAMVAEALFDEETERLGLTVTDAELTDIMLNRGAQILSQRVAQETGIQSINELYNMVTRPADYNLPSEQQAQIQAYWKQLEDQTAKEIVQQKFMTLFTGSLVANKLDAKAFYDETATPAHIAYAKRDYATLAGDSIEVTDADITNEWAKNKNAYKIDGELRSVNYLTVAVVPSAADLMEGQKRVEEVMMSLRSEEGTQGLSGKSDFVADNRSSRMSEIRDRSLRNFLDSAAVGSAEIISKGSNSYTIVKLLGRTNELDSVNIDFVAVEGKAQYDSIAAALKGGASIAQFKSNPKVQTQDSIWMSLLNPNYAQFRQVVADHPVGVYFSPDSVENPQGGVLYRINNRRPAVPVAEYAYITYTVDPSVATINKLESDLQAFLDENNNAADFANNAISAGYQVFPTNVDQSTPMLGNVEDSRAAIVWALEAKKGQVSPIFGNEQTGRLIAVAVNDIYEDFIPARDPRVHDYLQARVLSDKRGDKLMSQYAGKANDLDGYASLMGSRIDSTNVNFGQQMIAAFGLNESELQAQVANAKVNQLVGPVKANNALVVFKVISTDEPSRPYTFEESAQVFNSNRGAFRLSQMIQQILLGDKQVENNLSKFYHREN